MAAIFEGSAQDTLISLDSLIGFLKGKTTFDVQWSTNIVVTNWLTKYFLEHVWHLATGVPFLASVYHMSDLERFVKF